MCYARGNPPHAAGLCMRRAILHACMAGEDIAQELWLVSAVAGLGAARDLATDLRNARLRLDPTAAVAIRCSSGKDLEVLPDPAGGELLCPHCLLVPLRVSYKSLWCHSLCSVTA